MNSRHKNIAVYFLEHRKQLLYTREKNYLLKLLFFPPSLVSVLFIILRSSLWVLAEKTLTFRLEDDIVSVAILGPMN